VTPLALNSLFPYFIAETPKASGRAEAENFNPWLLFSTLSHFVGGMGTCYC